MCQDGQHHAPEFCLNKNIQVFSTGIFFDTLHFAREISLKIKEPILPDRIYFPSKNFENEFARISGIDFKSKSESLGSPLYDHAMFIERPERNRKSISFLTTLQHLVPKDMQLEIEELVRFCNNNNVEFVMKSKQKTPWVFIDKNLKVPETNLEKGFPYTSLSMILNTDIHISSYSTSACESRYFGKPCVNLESVENKKLTPAVASIKNQYELGNLFNSHQCKTVSSNLKEAVFEMIDKEYSAESIPNVLDNSSIRILSDVAKLL